MADDRLNIIISTVDRATPGLRGIVGGLGGLAVAYGAARIATRAFEQATDAAVAVMVRGVQLAADYEKNVFALERAQALLGVTNRALTEDLLDFAEQLQLATQFTDDDIVPAMVTLTNVAGVTGEALKDLTRLTADVAVTFNRDLNDAAVLVAKSARGVTDRMNELGLSISEDLQGPVERGAAAIELLRSRADGMAVAVGGTLAGATSQLGSAWDTLLRQFGQTVVESDAIRTSVAGLTEALSVLASEMETIDLDPVFRNGAVAALDLSIALIDLGQVVSQITPTIAKFAFGNEIALIKRFLEARQAVNTVTKVLDAFGKMTGVAALQTEKGSGAVDAFRQSLVDLRSELLKGPQGEGPAAALAGGAAEANAEFERVKATLGEIVVGGFAITDTFDPVAQTISNIVSGFETLGGDGFDMLNAQTTEWNLTLEQAAMTIEGIGELEAKALQRQGESLFGAQQFQLLVDQAFMTTQSNVEAWNMVTEQVNAAAQAASRLAAEQQFNTTVLGQSVGLAQSLTGNLIAGAFGAGRAWKTFMRDLIRDFVIAIAKATILRAIMAGITGGSSSFFTGASSTVDVSSIAGFGSASPGAGLGFGTPSLSPALAGASPAGIGDALLSGRATPNAGLTMVVQFGGLTERREAEGIIDQINELVQFKGKELISSRTID